MLCKVVIIYYIYFVLLFCYYSFSMSPLLFPFIPDIKMFCIYLLIKFWVKNISCQCRWEEKMAAKVKVLSASIWCWEQKEEKWSWGRVSANATFLFLCCQSLLQRLWLLPTCYWKAALVLNNFAIAIRFVCAPSSLLFPIEKSFSLPTNVIWGQQEQCRRSVLWWSINAIVH